MGFQIPARSVVSAEFPFDGKPKMAARLLVDLGRLNTQLRAEGLFAAPYSPMHSDTYSSIGLSSHLRTTPSRFFHALNTSDKPLASGLIVLAPKEPLGKLVELGTKAMEIEVTDSDASAIVRFPKGTLRSYEINQLLETSPDKQVLLYANYAGIVLGVKDPAFTVEEKPAGNFIFSLKPGSSVQVSERFEASLLNCYCNSIGVPSAKSPIGEETPYGAAAHFEFPRAKKNFLGIVSLDNGTINLSKSFAEEAQRMLLDISEIERR